MQSALNAPHLVSEEAAFAYVEAKLWPHGATCSHCGVVGEATRSTGKTTRMGLWNCRACRKPFTVRMGTIFESSHVPLQVWLQAIYLICSSKKGVSTRQMQRTIGGSMKTAWFLMHRIREAMLDGSIAPFGSDGGAVEVDETFIGRDPDSPKAGKAGRRWAQMNKVLTMVDRDSGQIRSTVVNRVTINEVAPILNANISRNARLMTDEAKVYHGIGWNFAEHGTVNHARDEYVSPIDPTVHTNTVEGTFSIFKRGMRGIYQHCAKKHLHRYLAEFDFRYSNRARLGINDTDRAERALQGVVGKRLTYRTASQRRPGAEARVVW